MDSSRIREMESTIFGSKATVASWRKLAQTVLKMIERFPYKANKKMKDQRIGCACVNDDS
jgi:hypothetical protein